MLTTFFSLQDENGRIPRGNQTPYPETSTFIGREKHYVCHDMFCIVIFTSTFSGVDMDGKQAGATFAMAGRLNPFLIRNKEKS